MADQASPQAAAGSGNSVPSGPRQERQRGRNRRGKGRGNQSQNTAGLATRQGDDRGGRRGGRGGIRGELSNADQIDRSTSMTTSTTALKKSQSMIDNAGKAKLREEEEDVEGEVCFICASPVEHTSVAPCNHRTCHICALRMRALYKTRDCAHCRVWL